MKNKWTFLIILLILVAAIVGAYNWMTGAPEADQGPSEAIATALPPGGLSSTTTSPPREAASPLPSETASPLPPAPPSAGMDGKALMEDRCSVCHSLDYVYGTQASLQEWATIVSVMVNNGAVLSPEEQKILVDYLAKNFGN